MWVRNKVCCMGEVYQVSEVRSVLYGKGVPSGLGVLCLAYWLPTSKPN